MSIDPLRPENPFMVKGREGWYWSDEKSNVYGPFEAQAEAALAMSTYITLKAGEEH